MSKPTAMDGVLSFPLDDRLLLGRVEVPDVDCLLVQSRQDARRMCAEVLGRRERPVIGVAPTFDGRGPVLTPADVRDVVGLGARIYLLAGDEALNELRATLGRSLAVSNGGVRIWWPGAGARCDPGEHPLVVALEGEPSRVTLEEFAHQFDLTRPRVRGHIRLIEDARTFLEGELARVQEHNRQIHQRLRDAQIECHALRVRAERAEARAASARRDDEQSAAA